MAKAGRPLWRQGAGSITKRGYPDGTIKRCGNVKDVAQHIGRIEEMIEKKRVLSRLII